MRKIRDYKDLFMNIQKTLINIIISKYHVTIFYTILLVKQFTERISISTMCDTLTAQDKSISTISSSTTLKLKRQVILRYIFFEEFYKKKFKRVTVYLN